MDIYSIRLANENDAEGIRLAHRSSVFEVASNDYPHEILAEWVIGQALLKTLESKALELNLKRLRLHSTVTAKNFYERNGYTNLGEGLHTKRSGKKMKCFKMEKILVR